MTSSPGPMSSAASAASSPLVPELRASAKRAPAISATASSKRRTLAGKEPSSGPYRLSWRLAMTSVTSASSSSPMRSRPGPGMVLPPSKPLAGRSTSGPGRSPSLRSIGCLGREVQPRDLPLAQDDVGRRGQLPQMRRSLRGHDRERQEALIQDPGQGDLRPRQPEAPGQSLGPLRSLVVRGRRVDPLDIRIGLGPVPEEARPQGRPRRRGAASNGRRRPGRPDRVRRCSRRTSGPPGQPGSAGRCSM